MNEDPMDQHRTPPPPPPPPPPPGGDTARVPHFPPPAPNPAPRFSTPLNPQAAGPPPNLPRSNPPLKTIVYRVFPVRDRRRLGRGRLRAPGRRRTGPGSALSEPSRVGGTCVIRGCVPKKLMRYGALRRVFQGGEGLRLGCRTRRARLRAPDRGAQPRDRAPERHLHPDAGEGRRAAVRGPRPAPAGPRRVRGRTARRSFTAERVLVAVGAQAEPARAAGIELAITSDEVLEDVYPLPRPASGRGRRRLHRGRARHDLPRAGHRDHAGPARRPAAARASTRTCAPLRPRR